eukprot:RCo002519
MIDDILELEWFEKELRAEAQELALRFDTSTVAIEEKLVALEKARSDLSSAVTPEARQEAERQVDALQQDISLAEMARSEAEGELDTQGDSLDILQKEMETLKVKARFDCVPGVQAFRSCLHPILDHSKTMEKISFFAYTSEKCLPHPEWAKAQATALDSAGALAKEALERTTAELQRVTFYLGDLNAWSALVARAERRILSSLTRAVVSSLQALLRTVRGHGKELCSIGVSLDASGGLAFVPTPSAVEASVVSLSQDMLGCLRSLQWPHCGLTYKPEPHSDFAERTLMTIIAETAEVIVLQQQIAVAAQGIPSHVQEWQGKLQEEYGCLWDGSVARWSGSESFLTYLGKLGYNWEKVTVLDAVAVDTSELHQKLTQNLSAAFERFKQASGRDLVPAGLSDSDDEQTSIFPPKDMPIPTFAATTPEGGRAVAQPA